MGHDGDMEDVSKKVLSSARQMIEAVGSAVPVRKKGYAVLHDIWQMTYRPRGGQLRLLRQIWRSGRPR